MDKRDGRSKRGAKTRMWMWIIGVMDKRADG